MNNKSILKDLIERSKVEPKSTITMEEFREFWKKTIEEYKIKMQEMKEASEISEHVEK